MRGCSKGVSPLCGSYEEARHRRYGPCHGGPLVCAFHFAALVVVVISGYISKYEWFGYDTNISNALVCRCVGYYGEEDSPSRRLGRPLIFCRTESDCPLENGYARPVEGIHVLVDMRQMQVIEFEDRNFVPLPPPDPLRNYTPAATRGGVDRTDIKPLLITQPEGPSFRVNGHAVEWQKVV